MNIPGLPGPLTPEMETAWADMKNNPDGSRYASVPLVYESRRANVLGEGRHKNSLFACMNPDTGVIKLDSASTTAEDTETLARRAHDLMLPLMTNTMVLDLNQVVLKHFETGYRTLGGVITLEIASRDVEYSALIVPTINKTEVYDLVNLDDTNNTEVIGLSRESASTSITANILGFVIENSVSL